MILVCWILRWTFFGTQCRYQSLVDVENPTIFGIQLCSSWQDFNWLSASHRLSAIAESFVMAAHRTGHSIFVLWFLLSSFFLASSQPSQIEFLPYFHTWCGLSANVECRSEMCCTRLTEYTGRKKLPKIRHLRTIAQICRAVSSQPRHISTTGKKLVKQQ